MLKLVALTGAGISAESGISTFRDADGLWEGHDVMTVASPAGWNSNSELVLDFYNQRRRQLLKVAPHAGHTSLAELEQYYDMTIVTQNVDNLHERAGSSSVLHLHGELIKARSTKNASLIVDWQEDISLTDTAPDGHPLRPHIVWFGEAVPVMDQAVPLLLEADLVIIVGTSMQVYPAAGLVGYTRPDCRLYYVDPAPSINYELAQRPDLVVIQDKAATALPLLVRQLIAEVS